MLRATPLLLCGAVVGGVACIDCARVGGDGCLGGACACGGADLCKDGEACCLGRCVPRSECIVQDGGL
jgi:hypothetical protein